MLYKNFVISLFVLVSLSSYADEEVYTDRGFDYVLEDLSSNPERAEKHRKNAEPILNGSMSAFRAFQDGKETAISAYLKLDNEDRPMRRIREGEEVRNEETMIMADIIKSLLMDYNSVEFIKQNNKIYVVIKGESHDLKQLLDFTNFNQITFTEASLKKYHDYIDLYFGYKPWLNNGRPSNNDFTKRDPEGNCKKLNFAEKEAINIYTGSAYLDMNALLRNKLNNFLNNSPYTINKSLKEMLLHAAVAVSGLNKMPDFEPTKNNDGTFPKYIYRGESYVSDSILEERLEAVKEGGDVTLEGGFLSAAYGKPVNGFFGEHSKCGIMFRNVKGKKIISLSMFGQSEREVLLPPTHVQWRYHKNVISDHAKNTVALFLAIPVTAPHGTYFEGSFALDGDIKVVVDID